MNRNDFLVKRGCSEVPALPSCDKFLSIRQWVPAGHEISLSLDPGLLTLSRFMRNKYLLLISHPVYGNLL